MTTVVICIVCDTASRLYFPEVGVLIVRNSNTEAFQDVTSRSLVYVYKRLGITYCLRVQG